MGQLKLAIILVKALINNLRAQAPEGMQVEVGPCMVLFVGSGITLIVHMGMIASVGMFVSRVPRMASSERSTRHHPTRVLVTSQSQQIEV